MPSCVSFSSNGNIKFDPLKMLGNVYMRKDINNHICQFLMFTTSTLGRSSKYAKAHHLNQHIKIEEKREW